MNLWVRSQDKECLTNISNIQYVYKNNMHGLGTYYDNLKILGTYKTKERTIEVLDEIQDKMLNGAFVKKINGLGEELDLIPNPILIYNMPED